MAEARARVVVPVPASLVYHHLTSMELHKQWVTDLVDVRRTGPRRRRWTLRGPGSGLELDIEITVDHPTRRFGFCMEGPGIVGYTMTRLHESGASTSLAVDRDFHAQDPRVAAWWGDSERRLLQDLWRFRMTLTPSRPRPEGSPAASQGKSDLTRSLSGPSRASLFSNW